MKKLLLCVMLGCVVPAVSYAASPAEVVQAAPLKMVIQVSDGDVKKWNLSLNNAMNVQKELGKNASIIEIVAFGPGVNMLKMDSEVGSRVQDAMAAGIKIVACENSMHGMQLKPEDMLVGVGYVKAGVVEIARKQQAGYAYIRP
ncbi:MAG: DsrE family protein [Sulfuriferula sp.]